METEIEVMQLIARLGQKHGTDSLCEPPERISPDDSYAAVIRNPSHNISLHIPSKLTGVLYWFIFNLRSGIKSNQLLKVSHHHSRQEESSEAYTGS